MRVSSSSENNCFCFLFAVVVVVSFEDDDDMKSPNGMELEHQRGTRRGKEREDKSGRQKKRTTHDGHEFRRLGGVLRASRH